MRFSSVLASSLFLIFTSAAHAYVPPSFYVLRMLARKHASLDEGKFRHTVSVYRSNGEVDRVFRETLVLENSGRATIRIANEQGAEVALRVRGLGGDRPLPYDLLIVKDAASIFDHFKSLGFPLKTERELYSEKEGTLPYKPEETVSYARFENKVAVVLGPESPEDREAVKGPQLWVEKDSYLPLRVVLPSVSGISGPLEYRFSQYRVHKSLLYPNVTQIFRDKTLWVKIETQEVKLGSVGEVELSRNKASPDSDSKEFLEQYFIWVR